MKRAASLMALIAAISGCGGDGSARDDSGQVTRAQEISLFDLKTFDCFNDPEPDQLDEIELLEVVPCEQSHDNEIFHSFTLAEGPMPTQDEIFGLAANQCFPAFDAFVGIEFEISAMDIFPLTPTLEHWEGGHRTIHCVLFNLDLSELVGSARGTAR